MRVLAVPAELGDELRDRIVEADAAPLHQRITLVVVATTLVSEATSKIVSSVIGSRRRLTARWPKAR